MAEFSKLITTKKGQALVAKMLAGTASEIDFTSISSSSTQYNLDELEGLVELTDIQQTSLISNKKITNDVAVELQTAFTNTDLKTGYYMRTLGLYAVDPDDGEILFAVTIETSGNCYMPPYNGVTVSGAMITLITTVGNADEVSLEVDPAAVATIGDVQELQNKIATLNAELSDIQAFVGYSDDRIYGVDVDFKNKTFNRIAGAEKMTPGKDFDSIIPFGGRRRCNLTDNGVVTAYLGDDAYTETGALTQEVTVNGVTYPVGTAVQVMVEQPKFYYKVVPITLEAFIVGGKSGKHLRRAKYYVSETARDGFKVHPAFVKNGVEHSRIYLSAYEGSLYDKSAGIYILDDAQVADFSNDLLCSIAGAKPISGVTQNLTRANCRQLAKNRGSGWSQHYTAPFFMDVMLMLIEYASFNMQASVGRGNCDKTDDGKTNMAEATGATSALGNASGSVKNGNDINIVSYRGEENAWANVWKWLDGMNLNNSTASGNPPTIYIADDNFADDTASNYTETGLVCVPYTSSAYGYISAFSYDENFDWCFVASEINGNSALPVGDYFWNHGGTGWRVAEFGAGWCNASGSGAVALDLDDASSHRRRGIGGRLVYVPDEEDQEAA